jgi:SanA protein
MKGFGIIEFFRANKKRFVYAAGTLVAVFLLIVFVCYSVIRLASRSYIFSDVALLPQSQVAVILGAAILKSGDLSPVLRHRADMAIQIYAAGKVDKILVTGNNSTLEYNEVNPVRKYLIKNNIPEEDIFLDHAGFDTYSSMYRARDIFLAESMIVVSQGFHLPRAVYIARSLGTETYGMKADNGTYLFKNDIRELGADVKAVFNVLFHRTPKYLGEAIPLSGDGQEYE